MTTENLNNEYVYQRYDNPIVEDYANSLPQYPKEGWAFSDILGAQQSPITPEEKMKIDNELIANQDAPYQASMRHLIDTVRSGVLIDSNGHEVHLSENDRRVLYQRAIADFEYFIGKRHSDTESKLSAAKDDLCEFKDVLHGNTYVPKGDVPRFWSKFFENDVDKGKNYFEQIIKANQSLNIDTSKITNASYLVENLIKARTEGKLPTQYAEAVNSTIDRYNEVIAEQVYYYMIENVRIFRELGFANVKEFFSFMHGVEDIGNLVNYMDGLLEYIFPKEEKNNPLPTYYHVYHEAGVGMFDMQGSTDLQEVDQVSALIAQIGEEPMAFFKNLLQDDSVYLNYNGTPNSEYALFTKLPYDLPTNFFDFIDKLHANGDISDETASFLHKQKDLYERGKRYYMFLREPLPLDDSKINADNIQELINYLAEKKRLEFHEDGHTASHIYLGHILQTYKLDPDSLQILRVCTEIPAFVTESIGSPYNYSLWSKFLLTLNWQRYKSLLSQYEFAETKFNANQTELTTEEIRSLTSTHSKSVEDALGCTEYPYRPADGFRYFDATISNPLSYVYGPLIGPVIHQRLVACGDDQEEKYRIFNVLVWSLTSSTNIHEILAANDITIDEIIAAHKVGKEREEEIRRSLRSIIHK